MYDPLTYFLAGALMVYLIVGCFVGFYSLRQGFDRKNALLVGLVWPITGWIPFAVAFLMALLRRSSR